MMSLALKTLLDLNLIDKDRYESIVLRTLANKDIITIEDLLNMQDLSKYFGIGKKKAELIQELKDIVKRLQESGLDDTTIMQKSDVNDTDSKDDFGDTTHILPSKYNTDKALEENLQMVLNELIEIMNEYVDRESQIRKDNEKKRVKHLNAILSKKYRYNIGMREIAHDLGYKESERVRQLLFLEFLDPLFNGEVLKYQVFKNLRINADLVDRIKQFRSTMIFKKYHMVNNCSVDFFEDVIGVDILQHNPFSYIVPSLEEMCYRTVLKAFFDEMGTIMEPINIDELICVIDRSPIIQRDIVRNKKTYDKDFICQLLNDDDIVQISDCRRLLKYEYIRYFGVDELGDIIQERALARIIADHGDWITSEEVIASFNQRYNANITRRDTNFDAVKKYGCQCGGWLWKYSKEELVTVRTFIEKYCNREKPFTMDEVIAELLQNGYSYSSLDTIRGYIVKHCAVNCYRDDYFCYRKYINLQSNPDDWRKKRRSGHLNWLVNEIHLYFENHKVDSVKCDDIVEYIYNRALGSYESDIDALRQSLFMYFDTRYNRPFTMQRDENSVWLIIKNNEVYNATDWRLYGLRGSRAYQRSMIEKSIHILRHQPSNQMSLTDLVEHMYNEIGNDPYDASDEDSDDDVVRYEPLTKNRIRQKLTKFIKGNELNRPIKLVLSKRENKRGILYATLDAAKLNEEERYHPKDQDVKIEYKSISQLNELDWKKLEELLRSELSFCQEWMDDDLSSGYDYNDVLTRFIRFIREDYNKQLNTIFPQKLYEFFIVSNPTANDRYCIMCNIAKNFEALIDSIYRRRLRRYEDKKEKCHGIYEKSIKYGFNDFVEILQYDVNIHDLDGYKRVLKYLNRVRNADGHGNWYKDEDAYDNLTEDQRNVQKILNFAALYIFTYAKYAM